MVCHNDIYFVKGASNGFLADFEFYFDDFY